MHRNTAFKPCRLAILALAAMLALPVHGNKQEQGREREKLEVVVRTTPAAWYFENGRPTGIDHDLLMQFAGLLNAQLQVTYVPDTQTALEALCNPRAQLAAGLLALSPSMKSRFRISPDYGTTQPRLIRHFTHPRVPDPDRLTMDMIEVNAEPVHWEILTTISHLNNDLTRWALHEGIDAHEKIKLVDGNFIEYTIADSHVTEMTRRFYPRIKEGIDIGPELSLNWVFGSCASDAVVKLGEKFLSEAKTSGTDAQIFDRHLGHATKLDYPSKLTFLEKVGQRLEKYKPVFTETARETGIDWTLLAALSYQESRWNPEARSPSGVEGLMMLTLDVARQFGVADRKDPDQNIRGGAYFLLDLKKQFPATLAEPDRTWFALAAYNSGSNNVKNAIRRAHKQGLNPLLWINTGKFLDTRRTPPEKPGTGKLLNNPYLFVYNIRAYQDLLAWNEQTLRFYKAGNEPSDTAAPPPPPL